MDTKTTPGPRVLVIRAGSIGTRHLRVIHGRGYPVMGCDMAPTAFDAIRQSIPDLVTFTDPGQALAQQPELVVVATPHGVHADNTVAAMQAGAHVLCEKPTAHTPPAWPFPRGLERHSPFIRRPLP